MLRLNGDSDAEWAAIKAIGEYMGTIEKYPDFVEQKLKLRNQLMIDWLSKHGIEVC